MQENKDVIVFGDFAADPLRRVLLRGEETLALAPKAFDTLVYLLQNRDRVVEKEEVLKAVWPDTFVEESSLAQNVSALRKALGETAGENRFIATIAGRGYRFVGEASLRMPPAPATEVLLRRETSTEVSIEPWLVLAVLAGLGLLAGLGYWVWRTANRPAAEPPIRSIAVLPFRHLTPAASEEYLGIGLTDAVITRLSTAGQLTVRPTSAVLHLLATAKPPEPAESGKQLGVDAVLDGSIQRAADRIRLTVQLIRPADGRLVWSGHFEEAFDSVFAVERVVSGQVASALAARLAAEAHPIRNAEAYRNYLQGRAATFRFTSQGLRQAIGYFERAIAIDPQSSPAYAGLADAYTTAADWILAPRQALAKAAEAAGKAVELEPAFAGAHAALAHALLHQWKLSEAEASFQRAMSLRPNDPGTYFARSEYLSALGNYDEASAGLRKALEIDPHSMEAISFLSWPPYLKGDLPAALEAATRAVEAAPEFWVPHMGLGATLLAMGKWSEALPVLDKCATLNPESTTCVGLRAAAHARGGNTADVRAGLAALAGKQSSGQYVSPVDFAVVYAALGEKARAFEWLERAYDDQSELLLFMDAYPPLASLRVDTRFEELKRKVKR